VRKKKQARRGTPYNPHKRSALRRPTAGRFTVSSGPAGRKYARPIPPLSASAAPALSVEVEETAPGMDSHAPSSGSPWWALCRGEIFTAHRSPRRLYHPAPQGRSSRFPEQVAARDLRIAARPFLPPISGVGREFCDFRGRASGVVAETLLISCTCIFGAVNETPEMPSAPRLRRHGAPMRVTSRRV